MKVHFGVNSFEAAQDSFGFAHNGSCEVLKKNILANLIPPYLPSSLHTSCPWTLPKHNRRCRTVACKRGATCRRRGGKLEYEHRESKTEIWPSWPLLLCMLSNHIVQLVRLHCKCTTVGLQKRLKEKQKQSEQRAVFDLRITEACWSALALSFNLSVG